MTAHTPAPWKVTPDSYVMTDARPSLGVAKILTHIKGFDANARLISAAPDLLDALKLIVGHGIDYPDLEVMARAAIAKAEGK